MFTNPLQGTRKFGAVSRLPGCSTATHHPIGGQTMKKFLLVIAIAALTAPAAFAAEPSAKSSSAQCKALQKSAPTMFGAGKTYKNLGACVRVKDAQAAVTASTAAKNAAKACRAERNMPEADFKTAQRRQVVQRDVRQERQRQERVRQVRFVRRRRLRLRRARPTAQTGRAEGREELQGARRRPTPRSSRRL